MTHWVATDIFCLSLVSKALYVSRNKSQCKKRQKKKRYGHKVLNFSVCTKKCGLRPENINFLDFVFKSTEKNFIHYCHKIVKKSFAHTLTRFSWWFYKVWSVTCLANILTKLLTFCWPNTHRTIETLKIDIWFWKSIFVKITNFCIHIMEFLIKNQCFWIKPFSQQTDVDENFSKYLIRSKVFELNFDTIIVN